MSYISRVTFDQWVMIVLTVIIAVSVGVQAWLAIDQTRSASSQAQSAEAQARIAERAEERASRPKINIESSYSYPAPDNPDPKEASKYYPGFNVTNTGFVPVTITNCFLESNANKRRIQLMRISAYGNDNSTRTKAILPHQLNRGEFFYVRYDKNAATLILESKEVRPYCNDSLDNKFISDWFTLKE